MNKYRKALKNYSSEAKVDDILRDIQQILVDAGVSAIAWMYESGLVSGVMFRINHDNHDLQIKVPFSVEKIKIVLKRQKIIPKRETYYKHYERLEQQDTERCYRVALANVRDWLDAQMTFLLLDQVELTQLFLPYIQTPSGKTIYEIATQSNYLSLHE